MIESLNILILDDEREIVELLKQWLEARGHWVKGETNPILALRALTRTPYDLVLLDLLMPNANGLRLISEILSLQPNAAVVIVSAIVDPHLAVVAIQEGGVMCLEKPVNVTDLDRVLQFIQQRKALLIPKNVRHVREIQAAVSGRHCANMNRR